MRLQAIRAECERSVLASPAIRGRYSAVLRVGVDRPGPDLGLRQPCSGHLTATERRLGAARRGTAGRVGGAGAATRRAVRSDDGTEIEEYGRIALQRWRAEYLYVAADGRRHRAPGSFDVSARGLHVSPQRGRRHQLRACRADGAAGGPVFFRRFAGPGEGCFGFEADLRLAARSVRAPIQLLLGYACRDGSGPPAAQRRGGVLGGVFPFQPISPDHLVALPPVGGRCWASPRPGTRPSSGLIGFPAVLWRALRRRRRRTP